MSPCADDWFDRIPYGPGVEKRPHLALFLVGFLALLAVTAFLSRQSRPAPSALARLPDRQIDCAVVPDRGRFVLGDAVYREYVSRRDEEEELEDRFAANAWLLQVGTVRNQTVPVRVQLREEEPDEPLGGWDHVVECSLPVESGELALGSLRAEQVRLKVPRRGCYRVRVCIAGLAETDGGNDRYHIVLWPGQPREPKVLKRFAGPQSSLN